MFARKSPVGSYGAHRLGLLLIGGGWLAAGLAPAAAEGDAAAASAKQSPVAGAMSAQDLRNLPPLLGQITEHVSAASRELTANRLDAAREQMEKARRLFEAADGLIAETPARGAVKEEGSGGGRRPRSLRLSPAPRGPVPGPLPWDSDDWTDPWWGDDAWDPFAEMHRMHQSMRQMTDEAFRRGDRWPFSGSAWTNLTFAPQADITETDNSYVVRLDIPGADKSTISVNLNGRVLEVAGQSTATVEQKEGDRILRLERRAGQFARSILLPGPVESDKVEARYENGVLTVTVPKAESEGPTKAVPIY
jgi:HSP20 family protein